MYKLLLSYKSWCCYLLFHSLVFIVDSAVHKLERNPLTESILHHETLNYPKEYISYHHNRVRRSLDPQEELHLNFKAHRRSFNIRLRRNLDLFASNLKFSQNTGFRPENFYAGFLQDDPRSRVHGFILDNIFEGRIHFGDGNEFRVESMHEYKHLNSTHHSVIYNVKDIVHPQPHMCGGIKASTQEHMNKEANRTVWKNLDDEKAYIKYTAEENIPHKRKRRATFDPDLKECRLYVRADRTFVTYAGGADRAMSLMTQYVSAVNPIYENTDFDNGGRPQQYSVKIERIDVMDKDACTINPSSVECQFVPANIGVEKFLDLASLEDHHDYCLSYVFAHRDFNDGVLGLAWIGDRVGAGGICDPYQLISGKMKSLNTGIVTNLNYGKTVAAKVTEITLAHEIGHNYGSQHDDPASATCSPGGTTGNFIMFPRATSGSDTNNYLFSTCSRNYIWPVIQAKSADCFKKRGGPICGNRIVEGDEECDCGYEGDQSCTTDKCCEPGGTVNGCKYKNKVTPNHCSSSNGYCCDPQTCQPFTNSKQCRDATDCAAAATCVSSSPTCPKSTTVPNSSKQKCNSDQFVCVDGECTGSLCLAEPENTHVCQCKEEKELCKVCCQKGNQTDTCKAITGDKDLPPGSPCEHYNGYCDILSKCRKVDAEGPLSRLKKWLFSSETFDNILDWMKEYWWACILIGLGLVLFMAAFIACCSVHTPSSNPNKPKPRQMTLPRGFSRRNQRSNPSAPDYQPHHGEAPPGYNTATRSGGPSGRAGYPGEMELR